MLFMEILRQRAGVTHELRRMNTYGVLAAYIPEFNEIVGQMQHDLFHVYTVDQHTLFVIRNIRRYTVKEFSNEFPLCSNIIKNLAKQEILIIAGLFHDISKGQGGNHSTLGAKVALEFCQQHNLNKYPSVRVEDPAGNDVIGMVDYTDLKNLVITFGIPVAGTAYLN